MKLPNFLIIGANKAGTTSLAYYCRQHPDIFMSAIKEPMFFNSTKQGTSPKDATLDKPYYCFTLEEYAALFSKTNKPMRGEASTAYLANPTCALWIKKIIPKVKLIAILRNPIERAFSNYKMYHGSGIESRSFEEAVNHELRHGPNGLPQGQHYLTLGLYASQIKLYRQLFPNDQLLICDYNYFNRDNVNFIKHVFIFLGVDEFIPSDLKRVHTSAQRYKNKDEIPLLSSPSIKDKMKSFFKDDINELQSYVNFDVLHWLS